jgi:hypothetical protein
MESVVDADEHKEMGRGVEKRIDAKSAPDGERPVPSGEQPEWRASERREKQDERDPPQALLSGLDGIDRQVPVEIAPHDPAERQPGREVDQNPESVPSLTAE